MERRGKKCANRGIIYGTSDDSGGGGDMQTRTAGVSGAEASLPEAGCQGNGGRGEGEECCL